PRAAALRSSSQAKTYVGSDVSRRVGGSAGRGGLASEGVVVGISGRRTRKFTRRGALCQRGAGAGRPSPSAAGPIVRPVVMPVRSVLLALHVIPRVADRLLDVFPLRAGPIRPMLPSVAKLEL